MVNSAVRMRKKQRNLILKVFDSHNNNKIGHFKIRNEKPLLAHTIRSISTPIQRKQ